MLEARMHRTWVHVVRQRQLANPSKALKDRVIYDPLLGIRVPNEPMDGTPDFMGWEMVVAAKQVFGTTPESQRLFPPLCRFPMIARTGGPLGVQCSRPSGLVIQPG
jgi:hypothetical protein